MRLDSAAADMHVKQGVAEVREYAGCEAYKALIRMLDALLDAYAIDMLSGNHSELIHRQSTMKQIISLRSVLTGDPHSSPRA